MIQMSDFDSELGILAPMGFWDPLGKVPYHHIESRIRLSYCEP
jgi:hypothetical protein